MTIPSHSVGATASAETTVDARWLMAFAAGIGDHRPAFLDPRVDGGVVGHPLFAVCPEWPVIIAAGRVPPLDQLTSAERARGVHATHDLHVHRLVRPGDRLTTTATVVGVERRRAGVLQMLRLDTVDDQGKPVATTWQGSMFLGLEVDGPDVPAGQPEVPVFDVDDATAPELSIETRRHLDRGAAHVYTECARIWNPIHTDVVVAQGAGLPDIILHGTATMAMAVSDVIDRVAGGDPTRVRRVAGSFSGMVVLPGELVIRMRSRPADDGGTVVALEVAAVADPPSVVLRRGIVVLGRP